MACEAMISQGIWGDGEITMTGEIIMTTLVIYLLIYIYIYTYIWMTFLCDRDLLEWIKQPET